MSQTVKVPVNVSGLKAKLAAKFKNAGGTPPAKNNGASGAPSQEPRDRRTGQDSAEARKKAKELKDRLESANLTLEEQTKLVEDLKAELAEKTARLTEIEPAAKQWSDYEHKERTKQLNRLPAELRKDVKELPLGALRTYVNKMVGDAGTPSNGTAAANGKTDWKKLLDSNDSKAINEAMEKDPAGLDAFLTAQKTAESQG